MFRNACYISLKLRILTVLYNAKYMLHSSGPPPVFENEVCLYVDFFLPLAKSGVYNVDGYNGTESYISSVIFNRGEVL